jgi:hypothetical protein
MKRFIELAIWPIVMFVVPVVLIANGLWPIGIAVLVAGYFLLPMIFGERVTRAIEAGLGD